MEDISQFLPTKPFVANISYNLKVKNHYQWYPSLISGTKKLYLLATKDILLTNIYCYDFNILKLFFTLLLYRIFLIYRK